MIFLEFELIIKDYYSTLREKNGRYHYDKYRE